MPTLITSKATQSTPVVTTNIATSHHVCLAGNRCVYTLLGNLSTNDSALFCLPRILLGVRPLAQKSMSRSRAGKAVLPARMSDAVRARTTYERWKGSRLSSVRAMPQFAKAEVARKRAVQCGWASCVSGRWAATEAEWM